MITLKNIFIFSLLLIFSIILFLSWHFYRGYNIYEHVRVDVMYDFDSNLIKEKPEVIISGDNIDLIAFNFRVTDETSFKFEIKEDIKSKGILLTSQNYHIFLTFPKIRPAYSNTLLDYDKKIPNVITSFSFQEPTHSINLAEYNKCWNEMKEFDYYERWLIRLSLQKKSVGQTLMCSEKKLNKYVFEAFSRGNLINTYQYLMETKNINTIFGSSYSGSAFARVYSKDGSVFQEVYVIKVSKKDKNTNGQTEDELIQEIQKSRLSKAECVKKIKDILSTFEFKLDASKNEIAIKNQIVDFINCKK